MKKFLLTLTAIFICTVAFAQTIRWHVGDTVYQTTTCESGSSITPPTPPVKNGYTFVGWEAYTTIEYLQSTGTQYIDTGIRTVNAVLYTEVMPTNLISCGLIGYNYDNSGTQRRMSIAFNSSRRIILGYGDGAPAYKELNSNLIPIDTISRINIQFTDTDVVLTINDNVVQTINNRNALNPINIHVNGVNTNNAASPQGLKGRFYSAKIWDSNNVLLRDFIPVLDRNGTPCMYDKVEKKFYYNAGTGDFIAGPVIGGE